MTRWSGSKLCPKIFVENLRWNRFRTDCCMFWQALGAFWSGDVLNRIALGCRWRCARRWHLGAGRHPRQPRRYRDRLAACRGLAGRRSAGAGYLAGWSGLPVAAWRVPGWHLGSALAQSG